MRGELPRSLVETATKMAAREKAFNETGVLVPIVIDSATFQRIVLTLHMCDMIEEEMLSRRKTIYTLKTAA